MHYEFRESIYFKIFLLTEIEQPREFTNQIKTLLKIKLYFIPLIDITTIRLNHFPPLRCIYFFIIGIYTKIFRWFFFTKLLPNFRKYEALKKIIPVIAIIMFQYHSSMNPCMNALFVKSVLGNIIIKFLYPKI